jgi:RNA polymerase sigma-70 factor (sigma-E family)
MSESGQPDVIGVDTPAADDSSFEEFVAATSARLFTMARLLTGADRAAAEDLLQGAFERAYRHWRRICRRDDPERYVRRILVNASVDRWRRMRRHPEAPLASVAEPFRADETAALDDRDLLLRALAALPDRQRAVLVLRYFEDLTEAQTATMLGCSIGTVKSQGARALTRLREIADQAPGPGPGPGPDPGPGPGPDPGSGPGSDPGPAAERKAGHD